VICEFFSYFIQSALLQQLSTCFECTAMAKVGGYEAMENQFLKAASPETYLIQSFNQSRSCGFPPADSFHVFRGMESNYPWPGFVFGLTLTATYYWCTNQVSWSHTYHVRSTLMCPRLFYTSSHPRGSRSISQVYISL